MVKDMGVKMGSGRGTELAARNALPVYNLAKSVAWLFCPAHFADILLREVT
jgi:hypothetical protein